MIFSVIDPALYPSYYKEVTIDQGEIQGLNTTPIAFLTAPGIGKKYRLDKCEFTLKNGTAYAGTSTAVGLYHVDGDGDLFATSAVGLLLLEVPSVSNALQVIANQAVSGVVNKPLVISAINDMTLGAADSTVKVALWYTIVPA
jgi:hypothetical protein